MFKGIARYVITALAFLLVIVTGCSIETNQKQSSNQENKNENHKHIKQKEVEKQTIYWGIDTASVVEEEQLMCVRENYGEPSYVGRYLETKEDVSFGLTKEEVDFFRKENLKIVLIYNHFTEAISKESGRKEAQEAISYAKDLGVPEGEYIFADIEPTYPVDPHFIVGWTETIQDSPYKPGLYGVFSESTENNLVEAYLKFKEDNSDASKQLVLWVSEVNVGITSKEESPTEFNPDIPDGITAHIWQYGIDDETCNIDTNLTETDMFESLW